MKSSKDFVIIKTRARYNTEAMVGNTKIEIAEGFNMEKQAEMEGFDPKERLNYFGEVVSVPFAVTPKMILPKTHEGSPRYGPRTAPADYHTYEGEERIAYERIVENLYGTFQTEYYTLRDIHLDVEVGDKIYFHYNIFRRKDALVTKKKAINVHGHVVDEWYFKVRYDSIICAVRSGNIIMIGGYCLVEPDVESWDEILIPTYYSTDVTGGKKVQKPKEQWIQTKVSPDKKYMIGFVRKVGKPLKGDICEVKEGDHVYYHRKADWALKIEGKQYFVMRQNYILAKIEG